MAKIDSAENKWERKIEMAVNNKTWSSQISADKYIEGVADFTGLEKSTVRNSAPAQKYTNFANNKSEYEKIWEEAVKTAKNDKRWKKNYLRAFGGA